MKKDGFLEKKDGLFEKGRAFEKRTGFLKKDGLFEKGRDFEKRTGFLFMYLYSKQVSYKKKQNAP